MKKKITQYCGSLFDMPMLHIFTLIWKIGQGCRTRMLSFSFVCWVRLQICVHISTFRGQVEDAVKVRRKKLTYLNQTCKGCECKWIVNVFVFDTKFWKRASSPDTLHCNYAFMTMQSQFNVQKSFHKGLCSEPTSNRGQKGSRQTTDSGSKFFPGKSPAFLSDRV